MKKALSGIFSIFFVVVFQVVNSYDCTWNYTNNVSFSLCDFQLNNQSQLSLYSVYDLRSTTNVSDYIYEFNICADMLVAPTKQVPSNACTNNTFRDMKTLPVGYCDNVFNFTCKGNIVPIEKLTAAYQLQNYKSPQRDYEKCYRLHDGVTPPTWSLYDEQNPASGIVLTYINGDWCSVDNKGKNREFRLAFICDNNYANVFDKEEIIEESEICVYETNIKSIWGCPQQCKVVNEQLCNGNGRCDYDFTNKVPKCFCYSGYFGEDCTLTQDDNVSTIYKDNDAKYVGLLIIVVVLLVIVLTIFFYLWLRFTNTKYFIPKSRSLISSNDDNKKISKSEKKQKQKGEAVHEDSDDEDHAVV